MRSQGRQQAQFSGADFLRRSRKHRLYRRRERTHPLNGAPSWCSETASSIIVARANPALVGCIGQRRCRRCAGWRGAGRARTVRPGQSVARTEMPRTRASRRESRGSPDNNGQGQVRLQQSPAGCRSAEYQAMSQVAGGSKSASRRDDQCGSAWKRDPGSGVIGVEKGPLIPVV